MWDEQGGVHRSGKGGGHWGWGQWWEGIFSYTGPLRSQRCAGWGLGVADLGSGMGWQFLRSALHTIRISLQNNFCDSHNWRKMCWTALRCINILWALSLYPVSEDEKSNGSDKNWSSEKTPKRDQQDCYKEKTWTKKGKKPTLAERERERKIFMMRFDSATSSFLALLEIKSSIEKL